MKALPTMIIIIALLAMLTACGEESTDSPSTSITLRNGVTLNHSAHEGYSCTTCHPTGSTPDKIPELNATEDIGKIWAHQTCTGCHANDTIENSSCKYCHRVQ